MNQAPGFKLDKEKKIIFVSGATGVGKSDFAEYLADNLDCDTAIINGDMGQIYAPLSIGTAKPDNINNCYLFDIMHQPLDLGVHAFRAMVIESLRECWAAGKLPIIVGGSGFYMKSLFYSLPSIDVDEDMDSKIILDLQDKSNEELYLKLRSVDAERAEHIHPHDRYRIERALFLWDKTFKKPSDLKPKFEPLGSCFYYFLVRDKAELRDRIDQRVAKMIDLGWIDEVRKLDDEWKRFLLRKKLIGYPEVIQYLEQQDADLESLIEIISYKTGQYAKRQHTFWRSFKKQLREDDSDYRYIRDIQEFDLTNNFECLKDIIVKKIHES